LLALPAAGQKNKKKTDDDMNTQTLPAFRDPPAAVAAETSRLIFNVSPLSNKGLLSQQIRDALKALLRDTRGAQIVKLRAFVAGSGDMRRVPAIVSEVFTDHKMDLPAIATVEVGALPMEGAQVVIESVAVSKKVENPDGLAFYPARPVAELRPIAGALRATCFLSLLDDLASVKSAAATAFPGAALNFVQTQRLALQRVNACEAVARFSGAADGAAVVRAPKLIMTGLQMAFRSSDADLRLAFERLGRTLDPLGASAKDVFWVSGYTLTRPVEDKARALEGEFFKGASGTLLLFEGLPSLDAGLGAEVIAAGN
jgi:hypothetical protein